MWRAGSPKPLSGWGRARCARVSASYLHKLSGDELVEVREKALKGDLYAAARLSVHAELERLARMVEACLVRLREGGPPPLPRAV